MFKESTKKVFILPPAIIKCSCVLDGGQLPIIIRTSHNIAVCIVHVSKTSYVFSLLRILQLCATNPLNYARLCIQWVPHASHT